jgi:predicted acyl esterase
MRDGVDLLADRWVPKTASNLPTAVIRTPYGRRGLMAEMLVRPVVERGFQVLIQSIRGGFGSGGTFDPLRCEREARFRDTTETRVPAKIERQRRPSAPRIRRCSTIARTPPR